MFSAEGADGLVESASKVEGGEADAGQGVSGVAGWIASNSDASSDMTSSEAAIAAACAAAIFRRVSWILFVGCRVMIGALNLLNHLDELVAATLGHARQLDDQ